MDILIGLFVFVILFGLYFIPAGVALNKKSPQFGAIFALNLLLGWTFLGWVVSLVWAMALHDHSS
ncbi:superinfection immunity protein [Pseudoduganella sp. RAF53_2]|uniref:superinfection immunity protein n=1 Tax=unclassified Pseudoduganella TaxID=2637179 RepID=UPI003F9AE34B